MAAELPDEVDLTGHVVDGIRYLGKARRTSGDLYQVLADNGSLVIVEVRLSWLPGFALLEEQLIELEQELAR